MTENKNKNFKISDIHLAAYLKMLIDSGEIKDLIFSGVENVVNSNRPHSAYVFLFTNESNKELNYYSTLYSNSESYRFQNALRNLKMSMITEKNNTNK